MTNRQEQIQQIAHILAEQLVIDPDMSLSAVAAQCNRDGWDFETPGPLGHVIRHEGVVLSQVELAQVRRLALDEAALA